jgi:hypothetical protein
MKEISLTIVGFCLLIWAGCILSQGGEGNQVSFLGGVPLALYLVGWGIGAVRYRNK